SFDPATTCSRSRMGGSWREACRRSGRDWPVSWYDAQETRPSSLVDRDSSPLRQAVTTNDSRNDAYANHDQTDKAARGVGRAWPAGLDLDRHPGPDLAGRRTIPKVSGTDGCAGVVA